jgi:hypothetical protein
MENKILVIDAYDSDNLLSEYKTKYDISSDNCNALKIFVVDYNGYPVWVDVFVVDGKVLWFGYTSNSTEFMLLDHKLNIQFIKNKCEEFVKNNLYNQ